MAGRKSKNSKLVVENLVKWKVGIYCRLSSDDGDKNESNSIINQKALIEEFISNEENSVIYEYYIDDGVSGTTFNRPGFKKMLTDIVTSKINTVIVKDLSRLGRNYVEAGRYLENIFPIYNTRFIAINDCIDSFKDPQSINSMLVPMKNLMNDEYAKDISKKVRSAYISMSKQGKFVGGTTPYGYSKNPENKYQLIINEEEAKIVKLIYKKYINGYGRNKIVSYLNTNNILCRKEKQRRKNQNIDLADENVNSFYKWSGSTIEKILSSEIYIGNLVWGRTGNLNYKNKTIIYKPKEEWVIVKNTHEPIIKLDIFQKVQELKIERFKGNRKQKSEYKTTIYANKIVCGNCQRAMLKFEDYRKDKPILYYSCRSSNLYGIDCKPHSIQTDKLNKSIIEAITQQVKLVLNLEKVMERYNVQKDNEGIKRNYKNKMNLCLQKIRDSKQDKKKMYEDWKFQIITKDDYLNNIEEIDAKINELNNELSVLKNNLNQHMNNTKSNDYWIQHFRRNQKIKELSKDIIDDLIDKIEVYSKNKVVVKFKYQDEYKHVLNIVNKYKGDEND